MWCVSHAGHVATRVISAQFRRARNVCHFVSFFAGFCSPEASFHWEASVFWAPFFPKKRFSWDI